VLRWVMLMLLLLSRPGPDHVILRGVQTSIPLDTGAPHPSTEGVWTDLKAEDYKNALQLLVMEAARASKLVFHTQYLKAKQRENIPSATRTAKKGSTNHSFV